MDEPRDMMGFGNQEEWVRFSVNFPVFVEKHAALEALRDKMFVRKIYQKHRADLIIYGLGRVCVEDFEQILNLCGNGFGIGGMQLLRGMYERQATAAFLSKYPDEVDAFIEYDCIHNHKTANQLKELYKNEPEILARLISEEEQKRTEEQYQAVRGRFLQTKCEKCKTTGVMMSWTKLNLGLMALEGQQPALKDYYYYQYYRPLLFSHSTFKSVGARVVFKEDDSFSFESDGQRNFVKEALVGAHTLLLQVFDLQNKHFELGFDDEIVKCETDYSECWASNDAQPEFQSNR